MLSSRVLLFRNLKVPVLVTSHSFRKYAENRRRGFGRSRVDGNRFDDDKHSFKRFEMEDFLDDDAGEDLYAEDGPVLENPEHIKEEIRKQTKLMKNVTLKTIERKYFKKPQEENLLTWEAKEQLRYLHNEFPAEWTVQRLAESFPVSEDGVKRLLKSKFVMRSEKEILKHDRKVMERWQAIDTSQGPISHRFMNLKFAGGNKDLPSPTKLLIDSSTKISTTGRFASIVKDYVERKEQKAKTSTLLTEERNNGDENVTPEVSQVTLKNNKNALVPQTVQIASTGPLSKRIDYRSLFKFKAKDLTEAPKMKNPFLNTGNLLDAVKHFDKNPDEELFAKDHEHENDHYPEYNSSEYEFSNRSYAYLNEKYKDKPPIQEEFVVKREKKTFEDIEVQKPDSARLLKDQHEKPYLYQKGNCYYDEDGEFLFKT